MANTIVMFDVFYHARNLQKAGFTEDQVEAQVELAKSQLEFVNIKIELIKRHSNTTILFDFFKQAKNLQKAGFTEIQIDAMMELVKAQIEFTEVLMTGLREKTAYLN